MYVDEYIRFFAESGNDKGHLSSDTINRYTYVRLVAQSTLAAILKLYSLEQLRFSLNLREELGEGGSGVVNFLKVYWK